MFANAPLMMSIDYKFCLRLYLATRLHKRSKILKHSSYRYVLTT